MLSVISCKNRYRFVNLFPISFLFEFRSEYWVMKILWKFTWEMLDKTWDPVRHCYWNSERCVSIELSSFKVPYCFEVYQVFWTFFIVSGQSSIAFIRIWMARDSVLETILSKIICSSHFQKVLAIRLSTFHNYI